MHKVPCSTTKRFIPILPKANIQLAGRKIAKLVEQYAIEAIAIGNGTASRETEQFVTSQSYNRELQVFVVSEDGASIYSASKTARDEFPDYDVTVRGAVSIGRRLMDPLAELVKIDAKSIGVGQYQHDVDQTLLKKSLDQTVESCVNLVGVNLNTASRHLLTYISGLGPTLAQNIVDYRTANGPFHSRKELMKVPAWEQRHSNNAPVSFASHNQRIRWTIRLFILKVIRWWNILRKTFIVR